MGEIILLILLIFIVLFIWFDIRKRIANMFLNSLKSEDSISEIESRIRRLEHYLLNIKQTEGYDPLKFIDPKTGKPILSDKFIEATKQILKDLHHRKIHKEIDPEGAKQIEKLEALREKMYGGEQINEEEIKDAFEGL